MSLLPWVILLAPLVSAVVIVLFTLRWKTVSGFISIAAVLVSFTCISLIFSQSCLTADAANKAFITTRIGDFGFMIGILMVWMATGSIVFSEIAPKMAIFASHQGFVTIAALLIFCGAVGKSAQFPLHVWLPDAMEGPTPISALIHAATMVAAGVYMLVRIAFVIQASQTALLVVAWIGAITAA